MKTQYILLILFGLCFVAIQGALFKKVLLDDKDALCLDGSPGAYFISQGKSPTKFMIFFEGGGWCGDKDLPSTIQNCYQRSLIDYGSSKKYPDTYTIDDGILSTHPSNSYSDFTKVFFKYCDGSGHQGTRTSPIKYKDTQLYFRGSNITIATLDQLQKKYGLFSKSIETLVTGISAGGLAAFTWADYIRNRTVSKNVVAAPDSGIFLDSPNFNSKQHEYRNMFMNLFKLSNTESQPPVPQCVAAFKDQPYLCMLAEHMHRFIKTPLFPVQSLYDSWSLQNILGIRCNDDRSLKNCNTDQMAFIEDYHRNTSRVLEQIGAAPSHGYWAPSCVDHGFIWGMFYDPDYEIPMHSTNSIDKTLFAWSQKQPGNHRYMDRVNWPGNQPCSGVSLLLQSE